MSRNSFVSVHDRLRKRTNKKKNIYMCRAKYKELDNYLAIGVIGKENK